MDNKDIKLEDFAGILDGAIKNNIITADELGKDLQVLLSSVERWRTGESCPNSATRGYIADYIENRKGLRAEFNLAAFLGEAEEAGVSLDDIANEFGYAVSSVYRWREEASKPHPALVLKIIEGVGKMVELKRNPDRNMQINP